MSVQHSQALTEEKKSRPMKEYGTVAVAMGAGIESLFKQLGVDEIVQGGQTNNPSAQDFLAAFDEVNARHIFVFPNNGNIIMAAQQAAQLYENGEVHVIESKDLGQGYAAISALNFESDDPEKITEMLTASMNMVTTGCVSTAIRDAELNGVHIETGDYIGFAGKTMKVSCKTLLEAARGLIEKMQKEEDICLITAFVGKDADAETVKNLEDWMAEVCPDLEFYTVDGGQEVYPFIFVVE